MQRGVRGTNGVVMFNYQMIAELIYGALRSRIDQSSNPRHSEMWIKLSPALTKELSKAALV